MQLYSWITILSDHGLINNLLIYLHIIEEPIVLLHNEFAIMVGLVYSYLPFMILPLYAAIERLNRSFLESASDLGANPFERFYKITLPLTKGGVICGSILLISLVD